MTRVGAIKRARAGFTLIEVMIALAAITVGVGGLIGLQTLSMRATSETRHLMTATDIAQTWAERLKLDAMLWTDQTGLANTTWLIDSNGGLNQWFVPGASQIVVDPEPSRSGEFDVYGDDVAVGDAARFFCVAYRFNPVVPNISMRVDIRVFWPRENTGTVADCALPAGLNPLTFHSVGLPIVVKRTVVPQ